MDGRPAWSDFQSAGLATAARLQVGTRHKEQRSGRKATLKHKQRLLLAKEATVSDAKELLDLERGVCLRQENVRDEDGFRFSRAMLSEPLWKFSRGCRLQLCLQEARLGVKQETKDSKGPAV